MTKLLITVDRGPDAKREECGECRGVVTINAGSDPGCFLFGFAGLDRTTQDGETGDYEVLRLPECLAAERKANHETS
jgi:hypothetical protein